MPRTVLVVDDTLSCSDTLAVALHPMAQLNVVSVSSAREALTLLGNGNDVVALITDLNMPVVDGFELIARVRAQPAYSNLPILVVSGDNDASTRERVLELGANAFFAKPFSPSAVRAQLEKLLHAD